MTCQLLTLVLLITIKFAYSIPIAIELALRSLLMLQHVVPPTEPSPAHRAREGLQAQVYRSDVAFESPWTGAEDFAAVRALLGLGGPAERVGEGGRVGEVGRVGGVVGRLVQSSYFEL